MNLSPGQKSVGLPGTFKLSFWQRRPSDCGPVCLAYLFSHYEISVSIAGIMCSSNWHWLRGTNMAGLIKSAAELGLPMTALKADSNQLLNLSFPLIAHTRQNHFIVVESINTWGLDLFDPYRGRIRVDKSWINESWSGYLLIASSELH